MRNRLVGLFLVAMALLGSACANTTEGLEEDANQNVDEAQEQLNEEEGDEG